MLKAYLKANNQTTFTNAEIRRTLRINPSNQKRYMLQLQIAELIKRAKGDKRKGYVYEVVNYEDYEITNKQIKDLLQSIINKLRSSK